MNSDVWLPPLLAAMLFSPVVLYFAYFWVVPRLMFQGYRRSMSATEFSGTDGSEGAGSIDIEYFTLYFDVRKQDIIISGIAPKARHWQIGAFDGWARLIDGAYVNHRTVKLDDSSRYRVKLTARPNTTGSDQIMDCSQSPRGIAILRVVLSDEPVKLPEVVIESVEQR